MDERTLLAPPALPANALAAPCRTAGWERPTFEVISLDCEITSYAPDGDPLF